MLRTLIVDDERLARKRLSSALSKISDVQIVGEAASGREALDALARHQPSLILLDIEMPDGDGFEVINNILRLPMIPEVVFVTAFNHYAVKAFEHGALDYLLKPFTMERLTDALSRVKDRIRLRSAEERAARLQQLLRAVQTPIASEPKQEGLWFRQGTDSIRIFPSDIQYISADRDYVEIATETRRLYLRCTLSSLEAQLNSDQFVRIHRSHIVQKSAIQAMRRKAYGKGEVELVGGIVLPVSATHLKTVSAHTGAS
ncbi:MAG: response regulator transcription factor [Pseudomonadota bacterium]